MTAGSRTANRSFLTTQLMIDTTVESFEQDVLKREGPVFVRFTATWCGPCRILGPLFKKAAEEYADKATFVNVDVDSCQMLCSEYQIRSVPAVVSFHGGEDCNKLTGAVNSEQLNTFIEENLGGDQS